MEATLIDLSSLVVRWLHIITGIAWIGASFYFIWLDNSLRAPPDWKTQQGVSGDLWAFHGGGIYEVAKYKAAPPTMPRRLHWFYWEAYSTWITGMLLLFVVYYLQAPSYLLSADTPVNSATTAILASLAVIASGVIVYELVLRLGLTNSALRLALIALPLLTGYCLLLVMLFPGRAAYIHMGIILGTIMVANVFIGIIPAQRQFVSAIENGETPDTAPLALAKLRSTHNNYLTLPVLFCMISNHYPLLYGHRYNGLILLAIILITAASRQYFNWRHRDINRPWILWLCSALFLALAAALVIEQQPAASNPGKPVNSAAALSVLQEHCSVCHAQSPSHPGFSAAPLGMILEDESDLLPRLDKVGIAVSTRYMPLGNLTGMSDTERSLLLQWLDALRAQTPSN